MPKTFTDVPAFLDAHWIATTATVDKSGKPHAVPVWFTYDDGKFHVQTDRKSVKVCNIQSNPRVALTICNMSDEAVIVQGTAKLIANEEKFRRLTQAHIDKFNRLCNIARNTCGIEYIKLDAQGCDSMGIPLFDFRVRCVIEVKPDKILFW